MVQNREEAENSSTGTLTYGSDPVRIPAKAADVLGCPLGGRKTIVHPEVGDHVLAGEIGPPWDSESIYRRGGGGGQSMSVSHHLRALNPVASFNVCLWVWVWV